MSCKQDKKIRRQVRKESNKIKCVGLDEFLAFVRGHGFFGRVKICLMIAFNKAIVK